MVNVNPKSLKNLKPARTTEEAQERGRKGAAVTKAVRQKRKQLKELAKAILDNGIQDERQIEAIRQQLPDLNKQDVTWGLVMLLKQFEKAKDGDAKAFELLRDTSGQKPIDQQEIAFGNGNIEIKIDGEDVE